MPKPEDFFRIGTVWLSEPIIRIYVCAVLSNFGPGFNWHLVFLGGRGYWTLELEVDSSMRFCESKLRYWSLQAEFWHGRIKLEPIACNATLGQILNEVYPYYIWFAPPPEHPRRGSRDYCMRLLWVLGRANYFRRGHLTALRNELVENYGEIQRLVPVCDLMHHPAGARSSFWETGSVT
ncbi:hypothetical protein BDV93DRAFT_504587 [Ceratobasidium sp. AG-I]|nr:hypothetical protein BDV93DRAFT_504587 [Ceratobasidium sp. AG-I]